MMPRWSFWKYRSPSGRDPVVEWYGGLSRKRRADVRVDLEYLRAQPYEGWVRPWYDTLSRECAGLGELRFTLEKVRWRLVGFRGPERYRFTILAVATERDRRFVPRETCSIAQARKIKVLQSPERADEWLF